MRRLLLGIALLLLPLGAAAQPHEALLTPNGTLFTVDTHLKSDFVDLDVEADAVLVLQSRINDEVSSEIVPASMSRGRHTSPAMAYERESGMLFVFWIRHTGLMYNELVFASRDSEGNWSDPTTFGDPFDFRENLRIAVTRKVSGVDEEGVPFTTAGVTVHAAWWEFDSLTGTEDTQYAMLTIDNGMVASVEYLDLAGLAVEQVVTDEPEVTAFNEPLDTPLDILKQPLLFAAPKQDSVVIVYGDPSSREIKQARIHPTKPPASDGRLRVPIGKGEGRSGAPNLDIAANGRIEGIYGDTDRMAIYTRDGDTLRYVILKDGRWSEAKPIRLDEKITSGAAVDAIRRLLSEN